jgi:cbb3-type cytochrome oxidase subunit 3
MASVSLGLSAFSPRRAYSTIGLVAFFLLAEGVTTFIYETGNRAGWSWADMTSLLAPITTLEGAYLWFFGGSLPSPFPSTMTATDYLAAAAVTIVVFWGLLQIRYRSISA